MHVTSVHRREAMEGTRLSRAAGVAVPIALAGLAGLHAAWALGWRWPGGSDQALAERVAGAEELPSETATWVVAGGLLGAATVVVAADRGIRGRAVRLAAWAVAAAFLARSVAYLPSDLGGGVETPFDRLDLALYSPLCLAIGSGTALVLWETGR
jgi:hypothetical protein